MKKIAYAALAAGVGVCLSGCATVLNGPNVDYSAQTDPEGATVRYLTGDSCTTPCEIELKRKDDQRVDISLDGYKPVYVLIQSKLGGSAFGNALLGGGIGAVVDGSNGSSNRLYPRPLIVRLAPIGSDEEAVLLDDDGEVEMTVAEHNAKVRMDVAKTIGPKLAGLEGAELESFEADGAEDAAGE